VDGRIPYVRHSGTGGIDAAVASTTQDPSAAIMPTTRETTALVLALAADAVQLAIFPLFAAGVLSPLDDCLDLAMFAILVTLLGWHPLLLPAMAAELIPVVDLCPAWPLAVLIILGRRRRRDAQPAHSGQVDASSPRPPSGPMSFAAPHCPHVLTWYSAPQR
jgi:hypothetical protein